MYPKTLKRAADFRAMPAGVTYADWRSQINDAITATVQAFDAIDTQARRDGRDVHASEARDQNDIVDERKKLEGVLEALDGEVESKGISAMDEKIMTRDGLTDAYRGTFGARASTPSPTDLRAADDDWTRDGVPLPEGRSVRDWLAARNDQRQPEGHAELSLSKYLRGIVTGDWSDADGERRAMNEGTQSAGGYAVPPALVAQIIDLARPKTRVLQAGARVIPMATKKVDVAKWTSDPTPAWHTESAVIAESDGALGSVSLTAKTLAGLTRASRELLEDAQGVQDELMRAFADQFALTIDRAALYGSGIDPEPRGVKNTSGITIDTSFGANGSTPANYDFLVNAVGAQQDQNEDPNAVILAPRTERTIALFKDTTNQPLRAPQMLEGLPRYATTQVPTNLTAGTSTNASDVFVADWTKLYVGVRTQLVIRVLQERFADTGELGFLTWWRGDIAVARPKAFTVVTGVRG